ncbi:hypothetical protein HA466_0028400 [Hirschfeldia incana]|nr:hypothetical protein HA466_0028400 [Hirschfeldia incana]
MSIVAASNSKKSQPSSSSFLSLPSDVALKCLVRIPRCYDLNISLISKTLRSLVRSQELYLLRSQLKSVYLSYHIYQGRFGRSPIYWITFRPGEKTTDYQLEPKSLSLAGVPSPNYLGSAVSVGSEIYFIGGISVPSTKIWILDTRSGHLRTAPSMKVGRLAYKLAVGVVDGKIYVIGGSDEDSQVEVFDQETQTWDFAGEEKVKCESRFSVSMKQMVYMVSRDGRVSAYSPREGINNDATEMQSDIVKFLCVVGNVLYACFKKSGLMWFNTKLKVWRRVVDRDGKDGKLELYSFATEKIVACEGKIAFLWTLRNVHPMNLMCKLIALDRVGEEIRGRIEWSGIMATFPAKIFLKDCLVVPD